MTDEFVRCIESSTGRTLEELRRTPIDEQRAAAEKKNGKRLTVRSYFPFIGRGNILHDRLVTHEQAEAAFRRALRNG
jgi:hypothetical protein